MSKKPSLSDALESLNEEIKSPEKKINNKDNNIDSLGLIDLAIYTGFLLLFFRINNTEKKDLFCPGNVENFCKEKCGDGKGKYYIEGKSNSKDTIKTLLNKINLLSDTNQNTVKWRRCCMLAIISGFVICLLVLRKIPKGRDFFLMVVSIFLIYYGSFNYYSFHYDKFPSEFIKENTGIIRDLLEKKNDVNSKKNK